MARPITLFTGQWADLPFEEVCRLASGWGYDGLEIACWGDHLDPWQAAEDDAYVKAKLDLLEKHGLKLFAISNHLKGQAVCDDPIDARHRGHPAGAHLGRRRPRGRAATRGRGDEDDRACRERTSVSTSSSASPVRRSGSTSRCSRRPPRRWSTPVTATSPTGGTRSSTCSTRAASGSPTRCTPRRSPTTTGRRCATMEAIGHREAFGLNWDPSHFVWQDLDPVGFLWDFKDRIYHVDCKDAKRQIGNGRNGRLGSHLAVGGPAPRLGLRLHRARRRALGAVLPDAQHHRLRRADLRRVGGRRAWTGSSAPLRLSSSSAGSPSTHLPRPSTRPSPPTTERATHLSSTDSRPRHPAPPGPVPCSRVQGLGDTRHRGRLL